MTSFIPVAIVGAGPVGLSLALGLARHGVRSVVLERNDATSEHSRAAGVHVRTREVFRQWDVEERFLSRGELRQKLEIRRAGGRRPLLSIDFGEVEDEAEDPGLLLLEQSRTERILLERVRESGMTEVRFGAEAVAFEAGEERVKIRYREGGSERALEASFLVGCDGAGSFVREGLGMPFEGRTYAIRPLIADVRVGGGRDRLPWPRIHNSREGLTLGIRLDEGLWRIIHLRRGGPDREVGVTAAELRPKVERILGEGEFGLVWGSRFRIHRRSAPRFREGRVVLAGDAAHVHSPVGGLGMNAGIQDAHNLAWKLAAALDGGDLVRLLDAYDVERRAVVVESVSGYTDLLTRVFLLAPAPLRILSFGAAGLALRVPRVRRMALRRTTMIDLDYPVSPILRRGDRAAGRRLPDPLLEAPDGRRVRLHRLLPAAAALIEVGDPAPLPRDVGDPVALRIGEGAYHDPSGSIRALLGGRDGRILVRPDLHVAWARSDTTGLREAIAYALGRVG